MYPAYFVGTERPGHDEYARASGLITGAVLNDQFFVQAANAPVDRSVIFLLLRKTKV